MLMKAGAGTFCLPQSPVLLLCWAEWQGGGRFLEPPPGLCLSGSGPCHSCSPGPRSQVGWMTSPPPPQPAHALDASPPGDAYLGDSL